MIDIILSILFGVCLFFIFIMIRNQFVFSYRNKIIDTIFSKEDVGWRREVFHSVSYEEMVYKFWKPLNSFYPDKKFLE